MLFSPPAPWRVRPALAPRVAHHACSARLWSGRRCAIGRRQLVLPRATRRPGELSSEEMETLLLRLQTNDVEYYELKALCKARGLGGKDSKENLRSKLARNLQEELLGSTAAAAPSQAAPAIAQGGGWGGQAAGAEGGVGGGWAEPGPGRQEWGQEEDVGGQAGASWGGPEAAPLYPPPLDPQALARVQQTFSALQRAPNTALRELLRERQLVSTGAREVLLARCSEALEREAAHALGGRKQLAQYAAEAVGGLSQSEVLEELRSRGLQQRGSTADAGKGWQQQQQQGRGRQQPASQQDWQLGRRAVAELESALVREWVEAALYAGLDLPEGQPGLAPTGSRDDIEDESVSKGQPGVAGSGGWGSDGEGADGDWGQQAGQLGAGEVAAQWGSRQGELAFESDAGGPQQPADPPLLLALLCCGDSTAQRQGALQAARLAVRLLQSDPCQGTLPAAQLQEGEGQPLSGVAVRVLYHHAASGALCELTWERLHGASAAELDAALGLVDAEEAPQALLATADLVLPLGPPALPASLGPLLSSAGAKVVGSSTLPSAAGLAGDSLALQRALCEQGFPVLRLLRLGLADLEDLLRLAEEWGEGEGGGERAGAPLEGSPAYKAVASWLEAQGLSPADTRVAVRSEVCGEVEDGAMVAGAQDAVLAALGLAASLELGEGGIVLEAEHPPGSVFFTVTVLGTPGGAAVALPPTGLWAYDPEQVLLAGALQFERFVALQQGADPAELDQVLAAAASATHPAYLGGPATPTQELRHSTPPAQLPPAAVQGLRRAAVKCFQALGLRDYAQFSGWVIPRSQPVPQAAPLEEEGSSNATMGPPPGPLGRGGRSFAQLLEGLDVPVDIPSSPSGSSPFSSVPAAAGAGADVDDKYANIFNGVMIDGSTRLDWIRDNIKPDPRVKPIPDDDAEETAAAAVGIAAVVEALEDLSLLEPSDACALPGGTGTVHFASLALTPPLASPASTLFQQAAAVGLGHRALLRQLLVLAAARAGAPVLPLLGPCPPVPQYAEEEGPVPGSEDDPLADSRLDEAAVAAFLEEEADILTWAAPPTPAQVEELEALDVEGGHAGEPSLGSPQDSAAYWASVEPSAGEEQQAGGLQGASQGGAAAAEASLAGAGDLFAEVDPTEWERRVRGLPDATIATDGMGSGALGGGGSEVAAAAGASASQLGLGAFGEGGASQQEWGDGTEGLGGSLGWEYAQFGAGDWALPGAGNGGNGGARQAAAASGRQRVWVLFGGEGPLRETALEGGLHAFLQLRGQPWLDVEAFFLEPPGCGAAEEARRETLLEKRLALLKLGASEEFLAAEHPELLERHILTVSPGSGSLGVTGVWRLTGSCVMASSIPEMELACEAALAAATVAPANLTQEAAAARVAASATAQELALAGVDLDGPAWGGAGSGAEGQPGAPRYTFLDNWALEAAEAGAVVLLALSGGTATLGPLQRLLEAHGVPTTASSATATEACADKQALAQQLAYLEGEGVSTPPLHKMSLPELAAQCGDEESAGTLFARLSGFLGAPGASLCIKPATPSGGLGVARVGCGRDLAVYAAAVAGWWGEIPGGELSAMEEGVTMPLPPPTQLLVEPWITTQPLQLRCGPGGALPPPAGTQAPYPSRHPDPARRALEERLSWRADANQWLEVVAHLVGEPGRMVCLGPSVAVVGLPEEGAAAAAAAGEGGPDGQQQQGQQQQRRRQAAAAALQRIEAQLLAKAKAEAAAEEGGNAGGDSYDSSLDQEEEEAAAAAAAAMVAAAGEEVQVAFELTPPPSSWVLPEAVQGAKLRLQMVADRLGLGGAARVEAFMHAMTGEVVVTGVDPLPHLGPDALLFKQAALEEPALEPSELLLGLVRCGLSAAQQAVEGSGGLVGDLSGYGSGGLSGSDSSLEADDALLGALDAPAWQAAGKEADDWDLAGP